MPALLAPPPSQFVSRLDSSLQCRALNVGSVCPGHRVHNVCFSIASKLQNYHPFASNPENSVICCINRVTHCCDHFSIWPPACMSQ